MESNLNVVVNFLLNRGYRVYSGINGNDIESPIKLRGLYQTQFNTLPSDIHIYYDEECGEITELNYYKTNGYMDYIDLESEVKSVIRNNTINNILNI